MLATNNRNKLREVASILDKSGLELVIPADLGQRFDVLEDGESFEANARLKSRAAFRQFGIPALADDSGLEIDALGGEPGVHSARFMDGAPYAEKCREILKRLASAVGEQRRARFRCCAALCEGDGVEQVFEGICPGTIAADVRGAGGFGYDPIFVPDGYPQTFAEMPPELKNRISHRARAFALVGQFLAKRTGGR